MKKKLRPVDWAVMIAVAALAVYLLMVKPLVGMANNGDFERIMGTVGLAYTDPAESAKDKYFGYMHSQFSFTPLGVGGYVSTQLIVVFIATLIGRIFGGLFDVRILAAVYAVLLLGGLLLVLRSNKQPFRWADWLLGALLVAVFADAGYLAYFNSLFGEPVSLVFLLLTVGFALALCRAERARTSLLIGFLVSAFFLTGSKVQNAPTGILLALLTLRFLNLRTGVNWRRWVVSGSVFLILTSAAVYFSMPKELKQINQYQTVFYGILKDSPTPEQDLRELGVDPKYAVLAGTNYFTPGTRINQGDPALKSEVFAKADQVNVALFYLKHPGRYLKKLEVTATRAFTFKMGYLGNYEKSAGKPYGATTDTFTYWSAFKRTVLPHSLLFVTLFFAAYLAVLFLIRGKTENPRKKTAAEVLIVLAAAAVLQFVVPVIGDGEADLEKHLFLFNVCFDLLFVIGVVWLAQNLLWNSRPKPHTPRQP